MSNNTKNRVILNISDNEGYSPDQIDDTITLGDLVAALEEAIEQYGEDARVILNNGQRYGAKYGSIRPYSNLFEREDEDEDEDF